MNPPSNAPVDPAAEPVIRAVGISKHYEQGSRSVEALPPLSFSLAAGELVVVVGPSRAGKTTLLNLLAGWETPDSGGITWKPGGRTPRWSEVAVVPQALVLLDELSVAENIGLPARFGAAARSDGQPGDGDPDDLVATLGLERLLGRSTAEISVGERQRVMVARALVGRPAIVLADEPTAHQDDRNADRVLALLSARGRGRCELPRREPRAERRPRCHPSHRAGGPARPPADDQTLRPGPATQPKPGRASAEAESGRQPK